MDVESQTMKGQMFNEIKEETGIQINIKDLREGAHAYSSPGLLDEEFKFFFYELKDDEVNNLNLKTNIGNWDEGEVITKVKLVKSDSDEAKKDAKLQAGLSLISCI